MAERESRSRKKKVRINYRKAARALALLILLVLVLFSTLMSAIGKGGRFDRELIRECGDPAAVPELKAKSAVVYSLDLDKTVYEKNADDRMAPYSVTKLLTCYLALENLSPDQVVTTSKKAAEKLEDSTSLELEAGEKYKAIDLVYAAMLLSANDAATALGEEVSGSVGEFAELMNKTVEKWGCENTHFANANGWEDKEHYTTARDLAVIARHCLENDTLRQITLTKKYKMPESNKSDEQTLKNAFLKAVSYNSAVTGGKTGSWSDTQCSIAFEFTDRGLSAVTVLMGDTKKGRTKDSETIIRTCHDFTPGFKVTDSDKEVCEAWVKHGAEVRVPLNVKGVRYAYPENGKARGVKVRTETDKLKAPVKKGDRAGKYYIYANGELAGQGYLYAARDVKTGWLPSYLYISNNTAFITLIAVLLILALGIILQKLTTSTDDKRAAMRAKSRKGGRR